VSRLARTLLLAAVTFCLVASSASAAPPSRLGGTLGDLWTTVLQTPTPQNPFAGGDTCVALAGKIVAPFGPSGAESCTVKSGTKIFVAAWTTECSTFEGLLFRLGVSVTSDEVERVPTGRRADSL
jgi:hypothetical protein